MAAGEGEFGIVHKAAFHGTLVAAKILKGSSAIALGDFRSEIEVLRKVHHPNAVQFLGACTKQEPYILVTGAERHFCTHAKIHFLYTPCILIASCHACSYTSPYAIWQEVGFLSASAIGVCPTMSKLQLVTLTLVLTTCGWCRADDRGKSVGCHAPVAEVHAAASHGDGGGLRARPGVPARQEEWRHHPQVGQVGAVPCRPLASVGVSFPVRDNSR